jgi:hypothetical protein
MGAILVWYVAGSFLAIPFLAFHLLRTRRDLNALRAALEAQQLVARGPTGTPTAFAAVPSADSAEHTPPQLAALTAEVQRLAEEQRALQRALAAATARAHRPDEAMRSPLP